MSETVEMKVITPDDARAILEEQERRIAEGEHNNRSVDERKLRQYANDMKRGHWPVNTCGIGFDTEGNLTNGRSRLWAIVKAGVPIKIAVFHGLNSKENRKVSSMDTEDCGRVRSVAQQLKLDGVEYADLMAASSRVIAMILTGSPEVRVSIMPAREILDEFGGHMRKLINVMGTNTRNLRSYLMGPLAIYRNSDKAKADEFALQWGERANLDKQSPVLALQRFFESPWSMGGGSERHISRYRHVALALFHFDAGSKVNTIRNSAIGCDWLRDLKPAVSKRVKSITGMDETAPANA